MAQVFLGLGSNIEPASNLRAGLDTLAEDFGSLELSPVYQSVAVGFDGPDFLNLVVSLDTFLDMPTLSERLRELEYRHGRPVNAPRFSSRQLDIDILTYDSLVGEFGGVVLPRAEILQQAFVLRPLAELAPSAQHPAAGLSYAALWQQFSGDKTCLRRVDFDWQHGPVTSQ